MFRPFLENFKLIMVNIKNILIFSISLKHIMRVEKHYLIKVGTD